MNAWGYVMIAVGCFFLFCATTKSDFFLYRLFAARSEVMWKENVHRFLQFVSLAIIIVGVLMAAGIIHR